MADRKLDSSTAFAEDAAEIRQDRAREEAAVQAEADRKQLDETEPGGKYLVADILVDAEGKPLKDT